MNAVLRLYPVLLLLAVWEAVCRSGAVSAVLLPAPSVVAAQLVASFGRARFLFDLDQTLIRLSLGLLVAIVGGVAIGLAAAQSRAAGAIMRPLVRVLAPIPKIAFYPALLLLLGFGHSARVTLVVSDAIFPVLLASYAGALAVDEKLIWSARAAGMSRTGCVLRVVLPAALPGILTGIRVAVVIGCIVVFFAEMVSPGDGLGDILVRAARSFQSVQMFVPLVVISLLGFTLDRLVMLVRNRFVAW